MKRFNVMVLLGFLAISCSREELPEEQLNVLQTEANLTVDRGGPQDDCFRRIKTLQIDHLNQAGHGFSFKEYFVEDWTGDGIVDIMGLKEDGRMFFYKGRAVDEGILGTNPPNTTDDPGRNDWKYRLHPGVQVGNGWNNFKEFYPGDWNGDGILDMMAMRSNNRMFKYIWSGSSFSPGVDVGGPGTGQIWYESSILYSVHLNTDGRSDLIEMYDISGNGYMRRLVWNGTNFNASGSAPGYDLPNDYYPFDYNHDGITDLMVRKPGGNMYYRNGIPGSGSGYSSEKYVGHGWNGFTDIYPGNNWSICFPISSLTGRKANGDLYSYLWADEAEIFNPGKKVGNGWNSMSHIFTGDITGDIYHRDDYLGIRFDGKLHAYGTVLNME